MAQGVLPWGVSLLRKLLGQIGNLAIQSSRGRCSFREKDGSSGLAICELSQFWPDQAWPPCSSEPSLSALKLPGAGLAGIPSCSSVRWL